MPSREKTVSQIQPPGKPGTAYQTQDTGRATIPQEQRRQQPVQYGPSQKQEVTSKHFQQVKQNNIERSVAEKENLTPVETKSDLPHPPPKFPTPSFLLSPQQL